jgi:hypothetical protein
VWAEVQDLALNKINGNLNMQALAREREHKISAGEITPTSAAKILFNNYSTEAIKNENLTQD